MANPEAEAFKNLGNECVRNKDFSKAVEHYTKAIDMYPDNYTYYSNRAAAYASSGSYEESLQDARKTVELNPTWSKGYSRLGTALEYLNRPIEAKEAYKKGLEYDPDNEQLLTAANKFSSPPSSQNDLFQQLMNNPQLKEMFNNPGFRKKMAEFKDNPEALLKDPEASTMFENVFANNAPQNGHQDVTPPTETSSRNQQQKEILREKSNKDCAKDEKDAGNQFYKKRMFDEAIEKYKLAKELDPDSIVYDLNITAVLFEQGRYEECVQMCVKIIERGAELGESFKNISKAYTRIGNVYAKQEKYEDAVKYYNKSLSEYRDTDVLKQLHKCEDALKQIEKQKYLDPEQAEVERQAGNKCFTEGDFPAAVSHYTEALKRDPNDAKIYSNRAAAYTKLMEYNLCIYDCDRALALDPRFVKVYLRKANALLMLKDFIQAKSVYERALDIELHNQEALAGIKKCNQAISSMNPDQAAEDALRDPEVQQILSDPSMRLVLETMKNDPASVSRYLSDPIVARKIEKLMSAGIVRVGHK